MMDKDGNWVVNTPDDALGLDMSQVRIVFYSVPRSAGTMIFQLLREMFPGGGIVWGHQFILPPRHAWVILSYRDFRDCAVSHWRYRFSVTQPMTQSFARVLAGWYLQHAWILTQYEWAGRVQCQGPLRLRYETHLGHPQTVYRFLRKYCPLSDPKPVSNVVLESLCLEQQRLIADSGKSALMQPGHVGSGELGQYREILDGKCRGIFDSVLGSYLREFQF